MYDRLRQSTPPPFYIIGDSAFPSSTGLATKVRTPLKDGATLPRDPARLAAVLEENRAIVSVRQAAEWGMRALQGPFARLRVPLDPNDHDDRGRIIRLCARLHQLRVRIIGLNQTRNTFLPSFSGGGRSPFACFQSLLFRDIRKADRVGRYYSMPLGAILEGERRVY